MALTNFQEEAAVKIAEGKKSYTDIAKETGISRPTLYAWLANPEFAAEVERIKEEFRKEVAGYAIAQRAHRVQRLQKRWDGIQKITEERAEKLKEVPGGSSGLLARDVKSIGAGEDAYQVDVYRFDAAMVKEERELAKQAAIEMGEWQERVQHSGEVTSISDDDRAARIAAILDTARARRDRQADSEPGDV
jgi:uncharacterized protein YerC